MHNENLAKMATREAKSPKSDAVNIKLASSSMSTIRESIT